MKKYPCGMSCKLPRFCKDKECKTCILAEIEAEKKSGVTDNNVGSKLEGGVPDAD